RPPPTSSRRRRARSSSRVPDVLWTSAPRKLCANRRSEAIHSAVSAQFPENGRTRRPASLVAAGVLVGALALSTAGCSSGDRSTDGGYVGTSASRVTLVPPDQRAAAPAVAGPRLGSKGTL